MWKWNTQKKNIPPLLLLFPEKSEGDVFLFLLYVHVYNLLAKLQSAFLEAIFQGYIGRTGAGLTPAIT